MGSSSRFARLLGLAVTAALLSAATASFAAPKKHKKPKPAPAANGGEIDVAPAPALSPALAPPPAPAAAPAPAPEPPPEPPPTTTHAGHAAAHAREPREPRDLTLFGSRRTLVFDDLSGFRASNVGGIGYSGPLGFSVQSFSENVPAANGTSAGSSTFHFLTFWFAPSADYFLFEHLSIGAILQVATTTGSYDQTIFGTTTTGHPIPAQTDLTFVPRVGWMLNFGERWGLWPRLGVGYASHQAPSLATAAAAGATAGTGTVASVVFDLDVGVLYRLSENVFVRAAPELTLAPASSVVELAVVAGFGTMWNL
jgi:hypothetical protein